MKKTILLLTICCALIACKKNDVSFTFTPTAPRAGQAVTFSNNSTTGEEWEWNFGDGITSTLKNPSHTYRLPGSYTVILKVDKKNAWTATTNITVSDTVPTFVCADSVFYIYNDYVFVANVYNPYNYPISYEWTMDDLVLGTESTLKKYFIEPDKTIQLRLRIILNHDTTDIMKEYFIHDYKTNSILIRANGEDYRQRIFGDWAEIAKEDPSATAMLDAAQDTFQVYNGRVFRLSELKTVFPELEGFAIANRKIYYRANGLWVAHIDGSDEVQIDSAECTALTLDTKDNRIYWANEAGVWYMPFIGSDNNRFVTEPEHLNVLLNISKLAADAELR